MKVLQMNNKNLKHKIRIKSKYNLIIVLFILSTTQYKCTQPKPLHFTREQFNHIRRSTPLTFIDDAVVDTSGCISFGLDYGYYLKSLPQYTFKESTFVEDDFSTLTLKTTSISYGSQHSFSGLFGISPINFFSTGLTMNVSFGEIPGTSDISENSIVRNNLFEWSLFFRFSQKIYPFSFAFRPELVFFTLNGENRIFSDSTALSGASIHKYGVLFKGNIATRIDLPHNLGYLIGLQYKIQPYNANLEKIFYENVYGIYTGISYSAIKSLIVSPFVLLTVKGDYTGYKLPILSGIHLNYRFFKEN